MMNKPKDLSNEKREKNMKDTTSTLDILSSCYPNLTRDALLHALKAVEEDKLPSLFLGYYLNHLNEYFCCQGDITMVGYGLIPKDEQAFLEKKLNAWLDFWSIDENTMIASHRKAMQHNIRVWVEEYDEKNG